MRALNISLWLYRKTVKRIQPAHRAMHRLLDLVLLPGLERAGNFRTIREDPFWFRLELLTRQHEVGTRRLLSQLVQPGMVVLDIGAHVGYFTRLCSRWAGESGRVIALEPHPETHQALRQNTRKLPNVTALRLAASEAEGSAELYDYLLMSASGSLHFDETLAQQQQSQMGAGDMAPRRQTGFKPQRYRVRTVALDDCLAELGLERVDVVKMDIEGAELAALRGMRGLIADSPGMALVMEYNPRALRAFGQEPVAALDEVLGMGFARMRLIKADGTLRDWSNGSLVARETARLEASMGVVNLLLKR